MSIAIPIAVEIPTSVLVEGPIVLMGAGWTISAERRADRDSDRLVARHERHPGIQVVLDVASRTELRA